MSFKDKIADAVAQYKIESANSDTAVYILNNIMFEDEADKNAKAIYDAYKDIMNDFIMSRDNIDDVLFWFRFCTKNGVNFDLEAGVRNVLNEFKSHLDSIYSPVNTLCNLACLVTKNAYDEDDKIRPDMPDLRNEIMEFAISAVANVDDAKIIVEHLGGKYQGLHINDVEAAEKFIADCKGKLSTPEIKRLQKTLKDVT